MFIFGGVLRYISSVTLSRLAGFVSVNSVANMHISGE